jgi:hypothetical protein
VEAIELKGHTRLVPSNGRTLAGIAGVRPDRAAIRLAVNEHRVVFPTAGPSRQGQWRCPARLWVQARCLGSNDVCAQGDAS